MENTMNIFKFIFFVGIIVICSGVYAQVTDTTAVTTTGGDDFIDLSDQATIIKVEPEKPRVTLITERIKPQFTDVNLNKSFIKEILSKEEIIKILLDEFKNQLSEEEIKKRLETYARKAIVRMLSLQIKFKTQENVLRKIDLYTLDRSVNLFD